ncbi:LysR family transcriptional regulator [Massilia sp. CF038]|uniref:LysR family transcriptional regulator n=1 Tax=Massilia sp. CF038 TaxID=1881045 RepID=UPI00091D9F70|nr:LysR family transcriptional regulator [Massilia sp. CF038]SHG37343.1 DNA-binding transcriptional regulator, LysR family [Massilia sp. CF038]
MTTQEPGWDLYRSFLAVLDAGSLSAAARELGLAQPTLGRHIDALESSIGYALFVRSQLGYLPTEQALLLKPYAQSLAATAAALLRAASGDSDRPRGTVRVTASEAVGCEVLPPILAQLHEHYPELQIELALSNRPQDLLRREADIAVRMVRPAQDALVARRVGPIELGLFAHRSYLARRGTPATLAELQQHSLIGFDHENAFIRSVKHHLGDLTRSMFALRSDSDLAQLAAIRAGFGIGICQAGIARRTPELVRVLPEALSIELDTWLAMHEDLRNSKRCSVVFSALADGLASYINR